METLDDLFGRLWRQYTGLTPQAEAIHTLLTDRGETVQNDHVAFRTFNDNRLGIERLAAPFEALGYKPRDEYRFEEKKLFARYWAHDDETLPKIFISELLLGEFSDELNRTVDKLVEQLSEKERDDPALLTSGRLWSLEGTTYDELYKESEYAAWMAAFGFCANHFTVFVNALDTFDELGELADFIKANGYAMNLSGGLIKGSPEVLLEQCSTMASKIEVPFIDGERKIPSCYYEFARRYPNQAGKLYQGFVAASADKIFESTNRAD